MHISIWRFSELYHQRNFWGSVWPNISGQCELFWFRTETNWL